MPPSENNWADELAFGIDEAREEAERERKKREAKYGAVYSAALAKPRAAQVAAGAAIEAISRAKPRRTPFGRDRGDVTDWERVGRERAAYGPGGELGFLERELAERLPSAREVPISEIEQAERDRPIIPQRAKGRIGPIAKPSRPSTVLGRAVTPIHSLNEWLTSLSPLDRDPIVRAMKARDSDAIAQTLVRQRGGAALEPPTDKERELAKKLVEGQEVGETITGPVSEAVFAATMPGLTAALEAPQLGASRAIGLGPVEPKITPKMTPAERQWELESAERSRALQELALPGLLAGPFAWRGVKAGARTVGRAFAEEVRTAIGSREGEARIGGPGATQVFDAMERETQAAADLARAREEVIKTPSDRNIAVLENARGALEDIQKTRAYAEGKAREKIPAQEARQAAEAEREVAAAREARGEEAFQPAREEARAAAREETFGRAMPEVQGALGSAYEEGKPIRAREPTAPAPIVPRRMEIPILGPEPLSPAEAARVLEGPPKIITPTEAGPPQKIVLPSGAAERMAAQVADRQRLLAKAAQPGLGEAVPTPLEPSPIPPIPRVEIKRPFGLKRPATLEEQLSPLPSETGAGLMDVPAEVRGALRQRFGERMPSEVAAEIAAARRFPRLPRKEEPAAPESPASERAPEMPAPTQAPTPAPILAPAQAPAPAPAPVQPEAAAAPSVAIEVPPFARRTPRKDTPERRRLEDARTAEDDNAVRWTKEIDDLLSKIDRSRSRKAKDKYQAAIDAKRAEIEKAKEIAAPLARQSYEAYLEDLAESADQRDANAIAARAKLGVIDRNEAYDQLKKLAAEEARRQGLTDPEEIGATAIDAAGTLTSYPGFNPLEEQVRINANRWITPRAKTAAFEELAKIEDLKARARFETRIKDASNPQDVARILEQARQAKAEQIAQNKADVEARGRAAEQENRDIAERATGNPGIAAKLQEIETFENLTPEEKSAARVSVAYDPDRKIFDELRSKAKSRTANLAELDSIPHLTPEEKQGFREAIVKDTPITKARTLSIERAEDIVRDIVAKQWEGPAANAREVLPLERVSFDVRAWDGNALEKGRLISDGTVLIDSANVRVETSAGGRKRPFGRERNKQLEGIAGDPHPNYTKKPIAQQSAQSTFEKATASAAKGDELEFVGVRKHSLMLGYEQLPEDAQYAGSATAYFSPRGDKGGEAIIVNADKLRLMDSLVEWDSVRKGSRPKDPLVFYKDDKPVALVMSVVAGEKGIHPVWTIDPAIARETLIGQSAKRAKAPSVVKPAEKRIGSAFTPEQKIAALEAIDKGLKEPNKEGFEAVDVGGTVYKIINTPENLKRVRKDIERGATLADLLPGASVGAIAGGTVGAVIGGPVGAGIGAIAGVVVGPAVRPTARWLYVKGHDLAGELGFVDNPLLEKFTLPSGISVAERYAFLRQEKSAGYEYGQELAARVLKRANVKPEAIEYDAAKRLPVLYDIRRRLIAGQQQTGGTTLAQANAEIARLRNVLGQQHADVVMREYTAGNKEVLDELKAAGMVPQNVTPDDYVHHVVMKWQEGKTAVGPGGGKVGVFTPGGAKHAKGSQAPIEMDAFKALAEHAAETWQALRLREFRDDIREISRNDSIRAAGLQGLPDDIGLYAWGPKGERGEIVQPAEARAKIAQALSQEWTSPSTGIRYRRIYFYKRTKGAGPRGGTAEQKIIRNQVVGPNDPFFLQLGTDNAGRATVTRYDAFPKELAEGLGAATDLPKHPKVIALASKVNEYVKGLYVAGAVVPNVQYQFNQALQDSLTGLANVAPEHAAFFARRAAKYAVEIGEEMLKAHRGERSPFIESLRKQGAMGGGFLDMFEEAGGVSAELLPRPFRRLEMGTVEKTIDRGRHIVNYTLDMARELNKVRETALRLAHRDVIVEKYGGSAEQGLAYGHRVMGNYWRPSPFERHIAPITQFTKWYTEALLRLTVRMAQDPVTGIASARGFWAGPMPKVLVGKLGLLLLNQWLGTDEERKKDAEEAGKIPAAGRFFSRAANEVLTPWKDREGNRITAALNGYSELVDAIVEPFALGVRSSISAGASEAARGALSRVGVLRLPLELQTGQKLRGGPIESDVARAMGTEAQARLNWQNKGIPLSDKTTYALEQMGGFPVRAMSKVFGRERPIVATARTFGAPISTFDLGREVMADRYKYEQAYYDQMKNELDRGDRMDRARWEYLWKWAAENGFAQSWKQRISHGQREEILRSTMSPEAYRRWRQSRVPAAQPTGVR